MAAPGCSRSVAAHSGPHSQKSESVHDGVDTQLPPFHGRLRIPRHKRGTDASRSLRQRVDNVYAVSPSAPLLATRLPHNVYVWGDVALAHSNTVPAPVPAYLGSGGFPASTAATAALHASTGDDERHLPNVLDIIPHSGIPAGSWAAISLGDHHAAGITSRGELYTWTLGTGHAGAHAPVDITTITSTTLSTSTATAAGAGDNDSGDRDEAAEPLSDATGATAGVLTAVSHAAAAPAGCSPTALQRMALPSGITVRNVCCGGTHTLAITTAGVVAWGSNRYGQCGLGTRAPAAVSRPEAIPELRSAMGVCQLAAGRSHSLALTAASQVMSWGDGGSGQLGLGDRRPRASPAVVSGLWALPVVQIAAGDAHSAAVAISGHAFIWGSNHFGQLGLLPEPRMELQQTPGSATRLGPCPGGRAGGRGDAGAGGLSDEEAPPGDSAAAVAHQQLSAAEAETRQGACDQLCAADSCGQPHMPAQQRQEHHLQRRQQQRLGQQQQQHQHQHQHYGPMSPVVVRRSPGSPCSPHRSGTPRTPSSVRRASMRRNGCPNQQWLLAMVEMGIPPKHARVALQETGNAGVEVATEWLFASDRSAILEELSDGDGSPASPAASAAATTAVTPTRTPTPLSRMAPGRPEATHDKVSGGGGGVAAASCATLSLPRKEPLPGQRTVSPAGGCGGGGASASCSGSGGDEGGPSAAEDDDYDWTADLVVLEPRRVPLKGVRQLAAGARHTVAVTDDGVYSWGDGGAGALGLGDLDDRDMPCKLEIFLEAAEAAAPVEPSLVPYEDGWSAHAAADGAGLRPSSEWGDGPMYGKSGPETPGPRHHGLSRLGLRSAIAGVAGGAGAEAADAIVTNVAIQRVACGAQHTLFLTDDGAVFWCGTMPYLGADGASATAAASGGAGGSTAGRSWESQPQARRLRGEGCTRGQAGDQFPDVARTGTGVGAMAEASQCTLGVRFVFSSVPQRLELPTPRPPHAAPEVAASAATGTTSVPAVADAPGPLLPSSACSFPGSSRGSNGGSGSGSGGSGALCGAAAVPVVYDIVARGSCSGVLMCSPQEVPQVLGHGRPLLLEQLQSSIEAAAQAKAAGGDMAALSGSLNAVTAGVRMVLSSPAAISAAFGRRSGMGLDGQVLDDVLSSVRQLFAPIGSSSRGGIGGCEGEGVASTVADLHRYSFITALQGAAGTLVDDLANHVKLLGAPERAQVLLAALQHPLLSEPACARQLLPKLVATVMAAPSVVRTWLVRWWSEFPGPLLDSRVVQPLQAYLTRELGVTKKLTATLMNIIKVLARVEEAASLSQSLPPEAFYNALISDKLDVQDHYSAWRQAQELAACRDPPREAPFSFCSYPFLLNARAKSHLLHLEARFQMEQSVAHARMEVQLYGGSVAARRRVEEGVVLVKQPSGGSSSARNARSGGGSSSACSSDHSHHRSRGPPSRVLGGSSSRGASSSSSDASSRGSPSTSSSTIRSRGVISSSRSSGSSAGSSSYSSGGGGSSVAGGGTGAGSFWNLFSLLRRRRRITPSNPVGAGNDLVTRDQRPRAFELPSPSECSVPGVHSDMCILRVRRSHLVEDALDEVGRQAKKDLFKPLRVHFIGEEGIDAGGVKKEFFALLVERLLSPEYGMMLYDENSRTYWFNPASPEPSESFFLLGLVLGLAVYNRVLLAFPAPLLLYQKLRGGRELGLRDLEGWQPELARGLRQLLEYDGPEPMADVFGLTFSVDIDRFGHMETVTLKPGGELLPVTEDNRAEYVSLLSQWHMVGSVAAQFDAFAAGFRVLCEGPAMSLFNAQELERLVCGNPRLDFMALRDAARYEGGYTRDSPTVRWLWDIVLKELGVEDQRAFLKFFTGSDRSPLGGLGSLRPIIQRDGPDSHKLPTAHTCFNTLLLPEYSSRTKLATLLQLAINNSVGFGLQ